MRRGIVVTLTRAEAMDMEGGLYDSVVRFATAHNVPQCWTSAQFVGLYASKARSILANLDPGSEYIGNQRLLTRLREGEFLPRHVADMRPEHVFPERWQAALDAKLRQDEYVSNTKPAAMTDMFTCRRCHKSECVYHELQLRSGDEPMSIFITCLNCGNRWRQG